MLHWSPLSRGRIATLRIPASVRAAIASALVQCLTITNAGAQLVEADLFEPGDGLITRDSVTGLEWLNTKLTAALSYDQVEADAGGWVSRGFRHATGAELCTLLATYAFAPVDAVTGMCPTANQAPTSNFDPVIFEKVQSLVALLGNGLQEDGEIRRTDGCFDDELGTLLSGSATIFHITPIVGTTQSSVSVRHSARTKSSPTAGCGGHFLVRAAPTTAILDFEILKHEDANIPVTASHHEDGFSINTVDLTPSAGPDGLATVGTLHPGFYGSTAILPVGVEAVLTRDCGVLFDAVSVDLHEHFFPLSPELTFTGHLGSGDDVFATFALDGNTGWETFTFGPLFRNLVAITWNNQEFPAHAARVDNLILREWRQAGDTDSDGVPDAIDNCASTCNSAQSNVDEDIDGDVCDICPSDPADQCEPGGSTAQEIPSDQGGSVQTPDGAVSLEFDPGDLVESATISVTQTVANDPEVDLRLGGNAGKGQAVAFYDLEPDGLNFANPVTLTVTADVSSVTQQGNLDLYRAEDTNGDGIADAFAPLGATCTVSGNVATCTVEIAHFSIYALIGPLDKDGDGVPDLFGDFEDHCSSGSLVLDGFEEPLAAVALQGAGTPTLPDKAFKLGRTLPLRLRMTCSGDAMTDQDVPPPVITALIRAGEAVDLQAIDVDAGEANDSSPLFRFSAEDGLWVHNFSTKSLGAGTYVLKIRSPEGQSFDGTFVLK